MINYIDGKPPPEPVKVEKEKKSGFHVPGLDAITKVASHVPGVSTITKAASTIEHAAGSALTATTHIGHKNNETNEAHLKKLEEERIAKEKADKISAFIFHIRKALKESLVP